MYKKTMIASGIAIALAALPVMAEEGESWLDGFEVSGELKNETAVFTKAGTTIGAASAHQKRDVMKSETSARLFINGLVGEGSELHAELRPVRDSQAIDGYKGHKTNTQQDFMRELYVDTSAGEDDAISLRIGKQQVVWGTADGIKLLDIINPTDWREMAQNSMDESRIPVWMVNAETDLENGGNLQFILSEAEENKIAGLDADGDQGQAFIMKGVDSVTGKRNGFLNVTPALAKVASTFNSAATGAGGIGGFQQMPTSLIDFGTYGSWNGSSSSLMPFTGFTVDGFAGNAVASTGGFDNVSSAGQMLGANQTGAGTGATSDTSGDTNPDNGVNGTLYDGTKATDGINLLYGMAQNGLMVGDPNGNGDVTNLVDTSWDIASPTAAFEYMPNSTFSTFNTFSGATSQYVKDSSAQDGANFGFRYKDSSEDGLNFSFNFFRHDDANPYIDMDWVSAAGEVLTVELRQGGDPATGMPLGGSVVARADVEKDLMSYQACVTAGGCAAQPAGMQAYMYGNAVNATTVMLKDSAGNYYGAQDPTGGAAYVGSGVAPIFRMTEKSNTINSFGASLDTAVETESMGSVVLRGEFLYNQDEMTPVVNKKLLAIGDLTGALSMKKADIAKYVLGADVTVMTNMMVSGQFIQFRNLDYVDNNCTGTTQMGSSYDCSEYTADMATMHLTNGLNKAEKNKEFYSLFFSKPFGGEQQHRWNNILMLEENGGRWNRFDVEYSFNDEFIGTAEMNKYWGDANTQFGQLEASSNLQLGLKYIF